MRESGAGIPGLEQLPSSERVQFTKVDTTPCVLHENHRWLLPIAYLAQQGQLLPIPCTLVMFDLHHDALGPRCLEQLTAWRRTPTVEGLVGLCESHLKPLDDDWLKAGMELGLFGDAVIFGVEDASDRDRLSIHTDGSGGLHRIDMLSLPREELAYQGRLSDLARRDEFGRVWDTLGWQVSDGTSRLADGGPKILVSIDLDCFVVRWGDYRFPWPCEVFEREFGEISSYWSTQGWSGASFLRALVGRAGILAICREPRFTGGPQKSDVILSRLNKFAFNGELVSDQGD